eukprot:GHVS01103536.1.p1 GENE.GHVS01103536.1~~GHVS01103536.1.p1  ORF type:complete len:615 (-),score=121.92 GHVS01103536.1:720-2564(-)
MALPPSTRRSSAAMAPRCPMMPGAVPLQQPSCCSLSPSLCDGFTSTSPASSSVSTVATSYYCTSPPASPTAYRGPEPTPAAHNKRLYDPQGPVHFPAPPLTGAQHIRGELRVWHAEEDKVISQNSSKRKVHRAHWLTPLDCRHSFPVALKFVEDSNARDGRSIKREIECHLYIHQRLGQLMYDPSGLLSSYKRLEDAWPCAEMFGYHLNKKHPGQSVLVTRKLSGPDFFDIIRTEHSASFSSRSVSLYEYHKLQWCTLALERVAQYGRLGIRHNDIKPDNIVLDFYCEATSSSSDNTGCHTTSLSPPTCIAAAALTSLASSPLSASDPLYGRYPTLSSSPSFCAPTSSSCSWTPPPHTKTYLDVKLIDLGTASMQTAKDFTGGTSWYESPEQKLLEFYTKKQRNPEAARQVDIGLPSDAWGAGLSITEVLMGRRVVDAMKQPHGPGALEFQGAAEGWEVSPTDWVKCARKVLGLDKEQQRFPICAEAARQVFEAFVVEDPAKRETVKGFLPRLHKLLREASDLIRRKYAVSSGSTGGRYRLRGGGNRQASEDVVGGGGGTNNNGRTNLYEYGDGNCALERSGAAGVVVVGPYTHNRVGPVVAAASGHGNENKIR